MGLSGGRNELRNFGGRMKRAKARAWLGSKSCGDDPITANVVAILVDGS